MPLGGFLRGATGFGGPRPGGRIETGLEERFSGLLAGRRKAEKETRLGLAREQTRGLYEDLLRRQVGEFETMRRAFQTELALAAGRSQAQSQLAFRGSAARRGLTR